MALEERRGFAPCYQVRRILEKKGEEFRINLHQEKCQGTQGLGVHRDTQINLLLPWRGPSSPNDPLNSPA